MPYDAEPRSTTASVLDPALLLAHRMRSELGVIGARMEHLADHGQVDTAAADRLRGLSDALLEVAVVGDDLASLAGARAPEPAAADELPSAEVDLGAVLVGVARRRDELTATTGRIVVEVPSKPVPVVGGQRVRYIVENLLDNAVKYSAEDCPVRVEVRTGGHVAVLSVRDQGIGISREDLPRVREPGFRSAQAEALGRPGTGLGLAMVSALVSELGGDMSVASRVGHGTRVTVLLPVASATRPPMPEDSAVWLTAAQAAPLAGTTLPALVDLLREGRLPALRVGVDWWVRRDHLAGIATASAEEHPGAATSRAVDEADTGR